VVILNAPETLRSGETFSFTIANVGGERIAWRRYRDDDSYDYGKLTVREDDTLWETSDGVGIWTYRFALLKDGAWSAWSEPVTVAVEAWQAMDLAAPQVQALPAQITRYEDLTVTVTGPADAQSFYVALLNADGETLDYQYLYEPGDATFPGYRASLPLGTLRVRVYDYGRNNSRNQSEDMTLQVVTGTPGNAPQLTPPDQSTQGTDGSFTFAISAANADKAVVRWYRKGDPNNLRYSEFDLNDAGEGAWTRTASWFGTGAYGLSFAVRIDGAWSKWTAFTGITVQE
jgi:hypothetical protein